MKREACVPQSVIPDLIGDPSRFTSACQCVRGSSIRAWIAGSSLLLSRLEFAVQLMRLKKRKCSVRCQDWIRTCFPDLSSRFDAQAARPGTSKPCGWGLEKGSETKRILVPCLPLCFSRDDKSSCVNALQRTHFVLNQTATDQVRQRRWMGYLFPAPYGRHPCSCAHAIRWLALRRSLDHNASVRVCTEASRATCFASQ